MSGGSLNYFSLSLEEHVGDFGDKELDELVKDIADLFHSREWYLSADTGIGDWREARDAFKAKWFTEHGRQERIERYLDEIHREVMESFCKAENLCKNCAHWTPSESVEKFGRCDLENRYLTHRSGSCERFCGKSIVDDMNAEIPLPESWIKKVKEAMARDKERQAEEGDDDCQD